MMFQLVDERLFVSDLIPKILESKYPLAVVNEEEEQLIGFILLVHVLNRLKTAEH